MVVDTSAVLAILLQEQDADTYRVALGQDPVRLISTVSILETNCVLESRRGQRAGAEFELFLYKIGFRVVPFDEEQLEVARQAWRKFGKGRHPAALNLGDCATYALAKVSHEPLLFKGTDFGQTDLPSVTL